MAAGAAVGRDAFMLERMRRDGIIRKLEIIGEAVKHLSDNAKSRNPAIPWRRIAGMRDRLEVLCKNEAELCSLPPRRRN